MVKVTDVAGNTASTTKTFILNSDPVGKPTIDGTVKENETLTAMTNAISDADVLGTFSYQWQADGKDISGATSSSYKLTDAEVDKKITVQVSYTDGQEMIEKVTSAESVEVVNVNTDPVGKPTIDVQPGADEITCDVSRISDDDGLGIFSYQWQADGKDISGATSGTFSMTDAEVGKRISVQVSYKDRHGTNEEVTSGTLIYGRDGSGIVAGDSGNNRMYGGDGNDWFTGGDGDDEVHGGANNDDLDGEDGDDTLYGDAGRDNLEGGAGDDFLSGGSGVDQLSGGDGNDKLYGGAEFDLLSGGAGNDTFIYEGNDGDDLITGFTIGEDVSIDFRGITVTLDDLETNNSLLVM